MGKKTVVDWANYMREIYASSLLNRPLLVGPNLLAEIKLTCCTSNGSLVVSQARSQEGKKM
jgi:hypothetical protein